MEPATSSNTAWSPAAISYSYVMAPTKPGILSSGSAKGSMTLALESGAGPVFDFSVIVTILIFNLVATLIRSHFENVV